MRSQRVPKSGRCGCGSMCVVGVKANAFLGLQVEMAGKQVKRFHGPSSQHQGERYQVCCCTETFFAPLVLRYYCC